MITGQHNAAGLVVGPSGPTASARAALRELEAFQARGGVAAQTREVLEAARVARERAEALGADLRMAMQIARERSERA